MPKRRHAIDDETLRREAGKLADDVLLLPQQVALLTGLSVGMLKERLRTHPPKPPHPEPREKPKAALWYSLGSVRRYRAWLAEQAAVNVIVAKRLTPDGFSAWLHADDRASEPWPFALLGPHKRPVDAWATIRGEVAMGRADPIRWLTRAAYLEDRLRAEKRREDAETRAEAMTLAGTRATMAKSGPNRHRVRNYS